MSGEVRITGGNDVQELNRIHLSVVSNYRLEDSTYEHALARQEFLAVGTDD